MFSTYKMQNSYYNNVNKEIELIKNSYINVVWEKPQNKTWQKFGTFEKLKQLQTKLLSHSDIIYCYLHYDGGNNYNIYYSSDYQIK